MASAVTNQRRDHVVSILCSVLDLPSNDRRARLLNLIDTDEEVEESVAKVEDLCSGSLGVFSADELRVAGKLRLPDAATEGTLTASDSWAKVLTLVQRKDNVEDSLQSLITLNIECGKIASAFRAPTSRYLGGSEKLSVASSGRREELKKRIKEYQEKCALLETKSKSLEDNYNACFSLPYINKSDQPKTNVGVKEGGDHRRIFDQTTKPHDHILTKLQALGAEFNFDTAENNDLVSDARSFANKLSDILHMFYLVYAEAIAVGRDNLSDDPSHSKAVDEERQAISEEIQSLWEEVIPVAHMAVEKEFLKPFLKEVDHAAKDAKLRNSTISAYILGVLRYMNQHLRALSERGYSIPDLSEGDSRQQPVPYDNHGSVIELMQDYFAAYSSVPIDLDSDDSKGDAGEKVVTKLQEFVANREGKLSATYGQMQTLFEAAAKSNLGNVEIGRAIISRRIVADGSLGLDVPRNFHRDDEAEEAIRLMEDEVEVVRERFRSLGQSGAAEAPDFVLQAYLKAHKRIPAKSSKEGCLASGKFHVACPACQACPEFTDFISRWSDA
ncbi:hypothetical protein UCREL1_1762 [Eutypa lata UCREL1]|uniref:Uncharacterized protein n=1 Tax=Eutypa lata (strain UCR-EL1) TaxID=1287681 RepID=M7T3P9_EUTLA|nr:hypothetical protein UCREL1_1762 [Eutypa lata UCREL1]